MKRIIVYACSEDDVLLDKVIIAIPDNHHTIEVYSYASVEELLDKSRNSMGELRIGGKSPSAPEELRDKPNPLMKHCVTSDCEEFDEILRALVKREIESSTCHTTWANILGVEQGGINASPIHSLQLVDIGGTNECWLINYGEPLLYDNDSAFYVIVKKKPIE